MLFKHRFATKGNTKKKTEPLSPSSNKTLYMTFALSFIFHVGLIYTIPAVTLFSEGVGRPASDLIMVDVIQDKLAESQAELLSDVPQAPDDRSLADTPIKPELSPKANPAQLLDDLVTTPNEIKLPTPPPIDKSLETETPYTLLANALTPVPESLRKRPVVTQATPIPQMLPETPKPEKLLAQPERLQPVEPMYAEVNKKPALAPVNNSQEKSSPAEPVDFPLDVYEKRSSRTAPENTPEKRVGFGKRPAKEMDPGATFAPSPFDVAAETSKRSLIGLPKKDANDQNRFGIFSGEVSETPPMKETAQDAFAAQAKKEAKVPEETKAAKPLETNIQIEGPVKGRKIVYQPPPPQIDIETEVEFKLKFWVLPDGTIGEVIPIKRGDTKLEGIAITYLKKWQFEPLPPDAPQQKIWGTIPIKFTAR